MKTTSFIADSTADALAQVRAQLGPQAMVLNVRRLPASGLSKLWQRPRIEVTAGIPEDEPVQAKPLTSLLQRIATLNREMPPLSEQDRGRIESLFPGPPVSKTSPSQASTSEEALTVSQKEPGLRIAPNSLRNHLFVGPPGVGKTTCLSKWLAQMVLLGGRSARVWRLDGHTANVAESLSVYGEILGVPVARCWSRGDNALPAEIGFIDLPGVDFHSESALGELAERAATMGALVHLVLNAAYDTSLLLEQVRAFSSLPITDLILTHLDEEHREEKLRDFAGRIAHPIGYLSAGQSVPGTFREAGAAFAQRGLVL